MSDKTEKTQEVPAKELTPEELEVVRVKKEKKAAKDAKKAAKKAEKEQKKKDREDALQKQREEQLAALNKKVDYVTDEVYGEIKVINSATYQNFKFTEVGDLTEALVGQEVRVRARVHTSRAQGNVAFVTLRKGLFNVQVVASKSDTVPKELIKFIGITPKESIVDVVGTISKPEIEIEGCTQQVEIHTSKFFVVSRASKDLPFLVEDASRPMTRDEFNKAPDAEEAVEEGKEKEVKMPTVSLKNRLATRILDLRVPTNKAIFTVQSSVCHLFRDYFFRKGYVEIHSPKILGGSSEGGAEVFKTDYFGKEASLAQSPQLFKQMALMGDFEGVIEIGPVFRAEDSNTPRHLCEFTGLDMEMEVKESYFEVLEEISGVFNHIFEGLNTLCAKELKCINTQFAFQPFIWNKEKAVMITFVEAVELLAKAGHVQESFADLSTPNEKALGKIMHDQYDTDFYIVHRYPDEARPFYTMPCADDERYTCSYDVFMRGEEIISGAQRVHLEELCKQRASVRGINPEDISYYTDSFKYGASPHGGFGTGLERVVKLFLDLHNVRQTSLFPRTPDLLVP